MRHLVRSGSGWRMLPIHFGHWWTVHGWFREQAQRFLFQSIKVPHAQTGGYDAGKKVVGRKRHIAVDMDGRLLMINLASAGISDSAGAQMIWP